MYVVGIEIEGNEMTASEYHDRRARIADAWARCRAQAAHWAQWANVCAHEKEKALASYLTFVKSASDHQAVMQAESIAFEGQF